MIRQKQKREREVEREREKDAGMWIVIERVNGRMKEREEREEEVVIKRV
jgi:hypothetical protein